MSSYAVIDPIIEKWAASLDTKLFTEWADAPARFFYTSGDLPFECFQISVDVAENNRVAVYARAIDTNDGTDEKLVQSWLGSIPDFDSMMSVAVATVSAWKARRRETPDSPSPWE
ncbi:hypothetical protein [Novosphingobium sp. Rr 2-17]|uniref:hypothetical protein n=1 Tax=Novosphingobium sp. Rr 2-17 TaxID=555793 RepID=UPI0005BD8F93|nr:hypothetical protein [Novosphingobium sp. Rr 2-17]